MGPAAAVVSVSSGTGGLRLGRPWFGGIRAGSAGAGRTAAGWRCTGSRRVAVAVCPVRADKITVFVPISVTVPMVMGLAVFISFTVRVTPGAYPLCAESQAAACNGQQASGGCCCYYSSDLHIFQSPSQFDISLIIRFTSTNPFKK